MIAASTRRCRWAPGPGTVSRVVSVCAAGRTDSIHLAPERINDYADSFVAGDCVVGIADVKLDCHGDLAFVAGEVPAVEGNMCRLHGCRLAVGFTTDCTVGFARPFAVEMFRHDWMFVGEYGAFVRGQGCTEGGFL